MEKQKKTKKARNSGGKTPRPHRPWDEVSLPGAGDNPQEQEPTILQVINNKINVTPNVANKEGFTDENAEVNEEHTQEHQVAESETSLVKETESDHLVNSHNQRTDESDCSSSVSSTPPSQPSPQQSPSPPPDHVQANVLDIESHLIETYDDYQTGEDSTSSVGIKELSPILDELTQGSSKIETASNVRTVIEVEPAGVKLSKPIDTLVQTPQAQLIPEVIEKTPEAAPEPEVVVAVDDQICEEIKRTAEKLVNEIEREVLATLRKQQAKAESVEHDEIHNENDAEEAEDTIEIIIQEPATQKEKKDEKTETPTTLLDEINNTLSHRVDAHLSEVTSILKSSTSKQHTDVSLNLSGVNGETLPVVIDHRTQEKKDLKLVDVPSPRTPLEAEERKLFIESLPQIVETVADTDARKLAADCKREYYQSLKKYLIQSSTDKPQVPLQTYRWEDLKRAKDRGGYPWTHLYKRPLGPNEEPEIVLLLRKSQELRFTSESPKSLKKVRIDEQVLVKETERYIQELTEDEDEEDKHDDTVEQHSPASDAENHSLHSESISCVSDSVLAVGGSHSKQPRKSNRLAKIRGILKRRKSGRSSDDAQSLPGTSTHTSRHHSEENLTQQPPSPSTLQAKVLPIEQKSPARCYPIMKKLKSMADRQKKRLNIKRITLRKDEKIVLEEETKILRLKSSPKSDRGEIPHFIEKQDSDDVLEIVELDESPSRKRKDNGRDDDDEIVLARHVVNGDDVVMAESPSPSLKATTSIVEPDEIIEISNLNVEQKLESENDAVPRKTPRLRREHVYEEIEQGETVGTQLNEILEMASVETLKQSLAKQDNYALNDIETANKPLPLDRMGSSEEEPIAIGDAGKPTSLGLLAPISSIDSASSEEDRAGRAQLSPVAEESDAGSIDGRHNHELNDTHHEDATAAQKPSIKKEASPAPSDKKVVTFSHVEDEAEPHREDIELPDDVMEATAAAANNKWKNMSDHEYEPIGEPSAEPKSYIAKEHSPAPITQTQNGASKLAMEIEVLRDGMQDAEELQKDLEERYFSSEATTPRTESRTDYEIHTSQVDSSALEELQLKPENRKKGFMATAQDRTRKMQAGFKNQAGKIKTKLRSPVKKPPPSGSPKVKERKRFKAPEFSKIKMPDIKRPDMSKLKEFKRPEFTKFNKPDMSKFKLPEKFSTLKLRRSKSFKENETTHDDEISGLTPETGVTAPEVQPQKKKFEFNFGTYPRAFRKKKKPEVEPELSLDTGTGTEGLSIIPSTETQPSVESSSSPQGDRGPGPVRSRWADKFSDVSYNDSEGSRYRRYGSEQESFDRESSLERRMKEDLEETGSEAATDLGILGGVADNKQFAEFDEENRAIHEISNLRAGEFKRRPMVHQDSDLRSEDSKEAEGWTDKEIQKNKLLRKAELEAEASYLKYPSEEATRQETISTASSGKKVVMEEIDDDEFFLRKRGISEDNIELRQYISNAIREGYDMPINALQHVGQTGSEPMEYGDYDVPPPKPRRLHKSYRPEDGSQEFERNEYGDDLSVSQNGSDFFGVPKRPLRKGPSQSKYSVDSQDIPMADERMSREQYFDDDEDYLRPPRDTTTNIVPYKEDGMGMNNLDFSGKEVFSAEHDEEEVDPAGLPRPNPPRRRKRQLHESSMDKDSYVNGFSGRSVSNSYLQPPDDVIVYRTEHEYHIPLATPENYNTPDGASAASQKSRSASRFDEDDRTSRGAESLVLDAANRPPRKAYHDDDEDDTGDVQEKFIIDMMENDGYAVVRKEPIPKPTPPARRKKFSRSPGERFSTMPIVPRTKRNTPPPERPPPPRGYTPSTVAVATVDHDEEPVPPLLQRKSALSLDEPQNYEEDDYEEPELLDHERPESPRNLQSGDIINKMKYRPLPPPPRPPREKRQRAESKGSTIDDSYFGDGAGTASDMLATSSTADSYDQNGDFEDDASRFTAEEVEVSTQTDPLPDDYVCEEFEITDDMKVIEPRTRPSGRTLDELLRAQEQQEQEVTQATKERGEVGEDTPLTEDEQLARGLQRFRDANQRSISERSRATSSGDRSKSQSRPQTPSSAVIIERRVSTPVPTQQHHGETMLEAALIVRPIDDLDLEEEALRREGLLTDSSQQSKSDVEENQHQHDEESAASATKEEESTKIVLSDYSQAPSSDELNKALEESGLPSQDELDSERDDTQQEDEYDDDNEVERTMQAATEKEDDAEVERTMRDYAYDEQKTERRYSSQYEEEEEDKQEQAMRKVPLTANEIKISNVASNLSEFPEQRYDDDIKEEFTEDPIKYDYERKRSEDREQLNTVAARLKRIEAEMMMTSEEEEPPQPPPRRKSTTTIEPLAAVSIEAPPTTLKQVEQHNLPPQEVGQAQSQLPSRMSELEVDRLRVHALQAGKIMVSQLHGAQISADELQSKSGSLVVQNIELPPGFIEDIVERVRSTSQSSVGQLLTVETQTSLQGSSETLTQAALTYAGEERELVPPPKPPRHRDLEAAKSTTEHPTDSGTMIALERLRNLDDQNQTTHTQLAAATQPLLPPVYATAEYLQTLTPLAFYNAMRREEQAATAAAGDEEATQHTSRRRYHHHHHHHHRRHRCDTSSSSVTSEENQDEEEDDVTAAAQNAEENVAGDEERPRVKRSRSRHSSRHRSRSNTRPRELQKPQQSVAQAGRQFISACSLSLVDIINQLTKYMRRGTAAVDKEDAPRVRHVPTLVVLFIVITFGLLMFLLSGRNVHTHHWDYFNPPGNAGRES